MMSLPYELCFFYRHQVSLIQFKKNKQNKTIHSQVLLPPNSRKSMLTVTIATVLSESYCILQGSLLEVVTSYFIDRMSHILLIVSFFVPNLQHQFHQRFQKCIHYREATKQSHVSMLQEFKKKVWLMTERNVIHTIRTADSH